ncbi:MAG: hypothetical protein WC942_10590 [Clostridia bacterium]|jgi:hypothetical protein
MIQESNNKRQETDVYTLLGVVNEFHTKSCYKLYMYAVLLAKRVNEYIDKGWLVLYEGQHLKKFVFYSMGSPCIGERDDSCTMVWIGNSYDREGRVWLHSDYTKKTIKKMFQKIQIFDPANAVRLNVEDYEIVGVK